MSKNKAEYQNKCDECKIKGEQMFARIFYRKIKNKWMHLCSTCWNKQK